MFTEKPLTMFSVTIHAPNLMLKKGSGDIKLHADEKAVLYHRIRDALIAEILLKKTLKSDTFTFNCVMKASFGWPSSVVTRVLLKVIADLQAQEDLPSTLSPENVNIIKESAKNDTFLLRLETYSRWSATLYNLINLAWVPFYQQNKVLKDANRYDDVIELLNLYSLDEYRRVIKNDFTSVWHKIIKLVFTLLTLGLLLSTGIEFYFGLAGLLVMAVNYIVNKFTAKLHKILHAKDLALSWKKYLATIERFTEKYSAVPESAPDQKNYAEEMQEKAFVRCLKGHKKSKIDTKELLVEYKAFVRAFYTVRRGDNERVFGEDITRKQLIRDPRKAGIHLGTIFGMMPRGLAEILNDEHTSALDVVERVKQDQVSKATSRHSSSI